jgi:hypothetical protein
MRNHNKNLKGKRIVFIDDDGNTHEYINTPTAAVKAGFLEEKDLEKDDIGRIGRPVMSHPMTPQGLQFQCMAT